MACSDLINVMKMLPIWFSVSENNNIMFITKPSSRYELEFNEWKTMRKYAKDKYKMYNDSEYYDYKYLCNKYYKKQEIINSLEKYKYVRINNYYNNKY